MLPGWHSASTRGSAVLGRVRSTSCRHMRASAPTLLRRVWSWWGSWARWTRTTAETCSSTTASLACFAMRRLGLQVHSTQQAGQHSAAEWLNFRRDYQKGYFTEFVLLLNLFVLFLLWAFLPPPVLVCPPRGSIQAVSYRWLHHSSVLWNAALHCPQPDVGVEGPR